MKTVCLIVTNRFTNDSRVMKEAVSLLKAGFIPVVLAQHGEGLNENEVLDGVAIKRVKLWSRRLPKIGPHSFIKYFEFIVRVVAHVRNSEYIHCNDIDTLSIGIIVKKVFRKPVKVIYDSHEYQAEQFGLSRFQKQAVTFLERWFIRYADGVITVSDGIASEYQRLYHIKKPTLVLNAPYFTITNKNRKIRELLDIKDDQVIFLYQGGLSAYRGVELLVESFSKETTDKCVVVFLGFGPLEEYVKSNAEQCPCIYYLDAVSPSELMEYTSGADFGLVFYENNCLNHYYCLPNKIFEYAMAGLPVISLNLYEIQRVISRYQIGVVADENSVEGVKEAIAAALRLDYETTQSNLDSFKSLYNWEVQEKALIKLYESV